MSSFYFQVYIWNRKIDFEQINKTHLSFTSGFTTSWSSTRCIQKTATTMLPETVALTYLFDTLLDMAEASWQYS